MYLPEVTSRDPSSKQITLMLSRLKRRTYVHTYRTRIWKAALIETHMALLVKTTMAMSLMDLVTVNSVCMIVVLT